MIAGGICFLWKRPLDPKISKSNVNLWKKHKDNSDILLIEKELSNYLYKSDIQ